MDYGKFSRVRSLTIRFRKLVIVIRNTVICAIIYSKLGMMRYGKLSIRSKMKLKRLLC